MTLSDNKTAADVDHGSAAAGSGRSRSPTLRIAIVDDHPMMCSGLAMHASPLSSGAVSGYVISNKEIAHDAVAAGRSVA